MSDHLLTKDDLELIQDYMLTKMTFLLTSGAGNQEWQFEIRSQEQQSAGRWDERNALLFDYTLARLLAAIAECQQTTGNYENLPPIGPIETFAQEFVRAVGDQDSSHAEEIWKSQNLPTLDTGPATSLASTLALVVRLLRTAPTVNLRDAMARLPAEYEPAQFVS